MKKIIHKLVWPLYGIAIVFLTWAGISAYLNASFILKDHTVIDAPIELVDTSSRTKRGHTSTTYIFNYAYNVSGKDYTADYSAVNEKGERYLEEPFIRIAYSNADPARVGALHVLERQANLGGLIKRALIGSAILGLVALFVYGWASPDEEDEGVEEPAKA